MRRNFTDSLLHIGKQVFKAVTGLFKRKKLTTGPNFTKKSVSLGKNMYQPLHKVVAMDGAIPFPHRVLNQRQKRRDARRDARRANRRVAQ